MAKRLFLLSLVALLATILSFIGTDESQAATSECPAKKIPAPKSINISKETTSILALQKTMLEYLNQGGSFSGLLPLTKNAYGETVGSVIPVDLNKDGVEEIIFASSVYNNGWISIYECKKGSYVSTDFALGENIREVTVVRIVDLMKTGYLQVILQDMWLGSACRQSVKLIGWNGTAFVRWPTHDISVFCPATIKVSDYNGDGQRDIYVRGQTAGNLEYGVGRGVMEIYQWKDNAFQKLEKTYLPSPYRIHALQDAQVALDEDNPFEAIELYEKAATRAYLKNEPSFYEKLNNQDFSEAYQTAFANFRLVTLWLSINGPQTAQSVIERMESKYLSSQPGNEFVELAAVFQENLAKTNDLVSACTEVTSRINMSYPYLAGYGYIGNWGYANVQYLNEDLCPFK